MFSVRVPTMRTRRDVRVISARICDVPGVQTLAADLAAGTVQVTGEADRAAVTAAIGAAGHLVDRAADRLDGFAVTGTTRTGEPPVDTFFATDITDLPEATPSQVVELADGDVVGLRIAPVAKRLGDATVRMLAYNGSVPGPTLKVRQGAQIVVQVTNDTDDDTTVHWHGLRLENRYDGVPGETQAPIPPGGSFTYRLPFVDAGAFWFHPHVREDYQQEMGLYGVILVAPVEPDYWPPAHRDVVLTLDDVLLEDGAIAPFSRTETNYAAMGRYGDVLLVAGETDAALTARPGEVVRLWLVNTANSRVFRVGLPGARMKLVGGDNGRVEREQFVDDVVLAPSERAVVDVLIDRPGQLTLQHRSAQRTHRLAAITVTGEPAEPALGEAFEGLRTAPEFTAERRRLDAWLAAPPDKILALVAEIDDPAADGGPATYTCPMHPDVISDRPGRCPACGMKLMAAAPAAETPSAPDHGGGSAHDHGSGSADGVEWEDDMADVNRQTTSATVHWQLLDRTAGHDAPPTGWRFTVGERVKIRVVNEMDSDHPMHHPLHIHGAGRFLVLARDDVVEPNLMWKDTVLIRTGQTVDLLLEVTHAGTWMAHCHIAEHMHSGMMFSFLVTDGADR